MLGLLVVTLAVLIAAALAGAAIWAAAGWTRGRCLAPAAGLAALLLVAAEAVRLPGGATTAAVACGALVLAGAGALARPACRAGRATRQATLMAGATAGLALLLAGLPFLASGRTGILGVGDDNDMSVHLTTAWALVHGIPDSPSLAGHGYPIGPHALVAVLGQGLGASLSDGFTALALAAPVLAAVAALAALDALRPVLRVPVAALVGLPYLMVAYLAQGSFKEQLEALLVLAFALALRTILARPSELEAADDEQARPGRVRQLLAAGQPGTPLGVLAAATLVVYSIPGLAWPIAGAGAAGALTLARHRRSARALARRAAAPALGAGLVVAVVVLAEAGRLGGFGGSSFAHEPAGGLGNLFAPIPPWEALGIWLRPDFRLGPHPALLRLGPALAASGLGLWALKDWLGRGESAVVGVIAGGAVIAGVVAATRNPYDAAKPLAVLAPLVILVLAGALRPGGGRAAGVRRAVGAVLLALAAASSVLVLRDAPIGPAAHTDGLEALRRQLGSAPTLYLGTDDFAPWALRGVVVARPVALYPSWTVPLRADVPYRGGGAVHPGLIDAATFDRFTFLITPLSGYDPAPPPNFGLIAQAGGYSLWRRQGPTPARQLPGDDPAGGVLDCATPEARGLLRTGGSALEAPAPVVGPSSAWSVRSPGAGQPARQRIVLPSAGAWTLSLQYASSQALRVSAPGLNAILPASLDRLGPHWLVGTLVTAQAGPVSLSVTPAPVAPVGRLLGARGATRAQDADGGAPLGEVALVAAAPRPRWVPLADACGRWVRSVALRG